MWSHNINQGLRAGPLLASIQRALSFALWGRRGCLEPWPSPLVHLRGSRQPDASKRYHDSIAGLVTDNDTTDHFAMAASCRSSPVKAWAAAACDQGRDSAARHRRRAPSVANARACPAAVRQGPAARKHRRSMAAEEWRTHGAGRGAGAGGLCRRGLGLGPRHGGPGRRAVRGYPDRSADGVLGG